VVAIVMDFHLVQNDKMVEDHSTIILVKFVFKWFSNSLEEDLKNVSINQIVTVNYFLEFQEILLIRVPSNHLCTDWV
jgi:hypothetical protein